VSIGNVRGKTEICKYLCLFIKLFIIWISFIFFVRQLINCRIAGYFILKILNNLL